ncbi:hypothetical protein BH10PSE14_BH10PSE14_30730 [soil metagenome]
MPQPSYPVPCDAIRVFIGFKRPELDRSQFFKGVGQTFMPGTPYMLQPLGLAAYLPAVLGDPAPGMPDEFALICYPSAAVWDENMHNTLRGRVYNQTHGGVYAATSGAAFPVMLSGMATGAKGPFYMFDTAVDWQSGTTQVAVVARDPAQADGTAFRAALQSALAGAASALHAKGIDQIIVTTAEDFAICWFHAEHATPIDLSFLSGVATATALIENRRVICRSEPPPVTLDGDCAFNFIFVRDDGYFLT